MLKGIRIGAAEEVRRGSRYVVSMVDRSAAREGRITEGGVYDVEKQAWDEARAKGNKYHQRFQKRCSSGSIRGVPTRNCIKVER